MILDTCEHENHRMPDAGTNMVLPMHAQLETFTERLAVCRWRPEKGVCGQARSNHRAPVKFRVWCTTCTCGCSNLCSPSACIKSLPLYAGGLRLLSLQNLQPCSCRSPPCVLQWWEDLQTVLRSKPRSVQFFVHILLASTWVVLEGSKRCCLPAPHVHK